MSDDDDLDEHGNALPGGGQDEKWKDRRELEIVAELPTKFDSYTHTGIKKTLKPYLAPAMNAKRRTTQKVAFEPLYGVGGEAGEVIKEATEKERNEPPTMLPFGIGSPKKKTGQAPSWKRREEAEQQAMENGLPPPEAPAAPSVFPGITMTVPGQTALEKKFGSQGFVHGTKKPKNKKLTFGAPSKDEIEETPEEKAKREQAEMIKRAMPGSDMVLRGVDDKVRDALVEARTDLAKGWCGFDFADIPRAMAASNTAAATPTLAADLAEYLKPMHPSKVRLVVVRALEAYLLNSYELLRSLRQQYGPPMMTNAIEVLAQAELGGAAGTAALFGLRGSLKQPGILFDSNIAAARAIATEYSRIRSTKGSLNLFRLTCEVLGRMKWEDRRRQELKEARKRRKQQEEEEARNKNLRLSRGKSRGQDDDAASASSANAWLDPDEYDDELIRFGKSAEEEEEQAAMKQVAAAANNNGGGGGAGGAGGAGDDDKLGSGLDTGVIGTKKAGLYGYLFGEKGGAKGEGGENASASADPSSKNSLGKKATSRQRENFDLPFTTARRLRLKHGWSLTAIAIRNAAIKNAIADARQAEAEAAIAEGRAPPEKDSDDDEADEDGSGDGGASSFASPRHRSPTAGLNDDDSGGTGDGERLTRIMRSVRANLPDELKDKRPTTAASANVAASSAENDGGSGGLFGGMSMSAGALAMLQRKAKEEQESDAIPGMPRKIKSYEGNILTLAPPPPRGGDPSSGNALKHYEELVLLATTLDEYSRNLPVKGKGRSEDLFSGILDFLFFQEAQIKRVREKNAALEKGIAAHKAEQQAREESKAAKDAAQQAQEEAEARRKKQQEEEIARQEAALAAENARIAAEDAAEEAGLPLSPASPPPPPPPPPPQVQPQPDAPAAPPAPPAPPSGSPVRAVTPVPPLALSAIQSPVPVLAAAAPSPRPSVVSTAGAVATTSSTAAVSPASPAAAATSSSPSKAKAAAGASTKQGFSAAAESGGAGGGGGGGGGGAFTRSLTQWKSVGATLQQRQNEAAASAKAAAAASGGSGAKVAKSAVASASAAASGGKAGAARSSTATVLPKDAKDLAKAGIAEAKKVNKAAKQSQASNGLPSASAGSSKKKGKAATKEETEAAAVAPLVPFKDSAALAAEQGSTETLTARLKKRLKRRKEDQEQEQDEDAVDENDLVSASARSTNGPLSTFRLQLQASGILALPGQPALLSQQQQAKQMEDQQKKEAKSGGAAAGGSAESSAPPSTAADPAPTTSAAITMLSSLPTADVMAGVDRVWAAERGMHMTTNTLASMLEGELQANAATLIDTRTIATSSTAGAPTLPTSVKGTLPASSAFLIPGKAATEAYEGLPLPQPAPATLALTAAPPIPLTGITDPSLTAALGPISSSVLTSTLSLALGSNASQTAPMPALPAPIVVEVPVAAVEATSSSASRVGGGGGGITASSFTSSMLGALDSALGPSSPSSSSATAAVPAPLSASTANASTGGGAAATTTITKPFSLASMYSTLLHADTRKGVRSKQAQWKKERVEAKLQSEASMANLAITQAREEEEKQRAREEAARAKALADEAALEKLVKESEAKKQQELLMAQQHEQMGGGLGDGLDSLVGSIASTLSSSLLQPPPSSAAASNPPSTKNGTRSRGRSTANAASRNGPSQQDGNGKRQLSRSLSRSPAPPLPPSSSANSASPTKRLAIFDDDGSPSKNKSKSKKTAAAEGGGTANTSSRPGSSSSNSDKENKEATAPAGSNNNNNTATGSPTKKKDETSSKLGAKPSKSASVASTAPLLAPTLALGLVESLVYNPSALPTGSWGADYSASLEGVERRKRLREERLKKEKEKESTFLLAGSSFSTDTDTIQLLPLSPTLAAVPADAEPRGRQEEGEEEDLEGLDLAEGSQVFTGYHDQQPQPQPSVAPDGAPFLPDAANQQKGESTAAAAAAVAAPALAPALAPAPAAAAPAVPAVPVVPVSLSLTLGKAALGANGSGSGVFAASLPPFSATSTASISIPIAIGLAPAGTTSSSAVFAQQQPPSPTKPVVAASGTVVPLLPLSTALPSLPSFVAPTATASIIGEPEPSSNVELAGPSLLVSTVVTTVPGMPTKTPRGIAFPFENVSIAAAGSNGAASVGALRSPSKGPSSPVPQSPVLRAAASTDSLFIEPLDEGGSALSSSMAAAAGGASAHTATMMMTTGNGPASSSSLYLSESMMLEDGDDHDGGVMLEPEPVGDDLCLTLTNTKRNNRRAALPLATAASLASSSVLGPSASTAFARGGGDGGLPPRTIVIQKVGHANADQASASAVASLNGTNGGGAVPPLKSGSNSAVVPELSDNTSMLALGATVIARAGKVAMLSAQAVSAAATAADKPLIRTDSKEIAAAASAMLAEATAAASAIGAAADPAAASAAGGAAGAAATTDGGAAAAAAAVDPATGAPIPAPGAGGSGKDKSTPYVLIPRRLLTGTMAAFRASQQQQQAAAAGGRAQRNSSHNNGRRRSSVMGSGIPNVNAVNSATGLVEPPPAEGGGEDGGEEDEEDEEEEDGEGSASGSSAAGANSGGGDGDGSTNRSNRPSNINVGLGTGAGVSRGLLPDGLTVVQAQQRAKVIKALQAMSSLQSRGIIVAGQGKMMASPAVHRPDVIAAVESQGAGQANAAAQARAAAGGLEGIKPQNNGMSLVLDANGMPLDRPDTPSDLRDPLRDATVGSASALLQNTRANSTAGSPRRARGGAAGEGSLASPSLFTSPAGSPGFGGGGGGGSFSPQGSMRSLPPAQGGAISSRKNAGGAAPGGLTSGRGGGTAMSTGSKALSAIGSLVSSRGSAATAAAGVGSLQSIAAAFRDAATRATRAALAASVRGSAAAQAAANNAKTTLGMALAMKEQEEAKESARKAGKSTGNLALDANVSITASVQQDPFLLSAIGLLPGSRWWHKHGYWQAAMAKVAAGENPMLVNSLASIGGDSQSLFTEGLSTEEEAYSSVIRPTLETRFAALVERRKASKLREKKRMKALKKALRRKVKEEAKQARTRNAAVSGALGVTSGGPGLLRLPPAIAAGVPGRGNALPPAPPSRGSNLHSRRSGLRTAGTDATGTTGVSTVSAISYIAGQPKGLAAQRYNEERARQKREKLGLPPGGDDDGKDDEQSLNSEEREERRRRKAPSSSFHYDDGGWLREGPPKEAYELEREELLKLQKEEDGSSSDEDDDDEEDQDDLVEKSSMRSQSPEMKNRRKYGSKVPPPPAIQLTTSTTSAVSLAMLQQRAALSAALPLSHGIRLKALGINGSKKALPTRLTAALPRPPLTLSKPNVNPLEGLYSAVSDALLAVEMTKYKEEQKERAKAKVEVQALEDAGLLPVGTLANPHADPIVVLRKFREQRDKAREARRKKEQETTRELAYQRAVQLAETTGEPVPSKREYLVANGLMTIEEARAEEEAENASASLDRNSEAIIPIGQRGHVRQRLAACGGSLGHTLEALRQLAKEFKKMSHHSREIAAKKLKEAQRQADSDPLTVKVSMVNGFIGPDGSVVSSVVGVPPGGVMPEVVPRPWADAALLAANDGLTNRGMGTSQANLVAGGVGSGPSMVAPSASASVGGDPSLIQASLAGAEAEDGWGNFVGGRHRSLVPSTVPVAITPYDSRMPTLAPLASRILTERKFLALDRPNDAPPAVLAAQASELLRQQEVEAYRSHHHQQLLLLQQQQQQLQLQQQQEFALSTVGAGTGEEYGQQHQQQQLPPGHDQSFVSTASASSASSSASSSTTAALLLAATPAIPPSLTNLSVNRGGGSNGTSKQVSMQGSAVLSSHSSSVVDGFTLVPAEEVTLALSARSAALSAAQAAEKASLAALARANGLPVPNGEEEGDFDSLHSEASGASAGFADGAPSKPARPPPATFGFSDRLTENARQQFFHPKQQPQPQVQQSGSGKPPLPGSGPVPMSAPPASYKAPIGPRGKGVGTGVMPPDQEDFQRRQTEALVLQQAQDRLAHFAGTDYHPEASISSVASSHLGLASSIAASKAGDELLDDGMLGTKGSFLGFGPSGLPALVPAVAGKDSKSLTGRSALMASHQQQHGASHGMFNLSLQDSVASVDDTTAAAAALASASSRTAGSSSGSITTDGHQFVAMMTRKTRASLTGAQSGSSGEDGSNNNSQASFIGTERMMALLEQQGGELTEPSLDELVETVTARARAESQSSLKAAPMQLQQQQQQKRQHRIGGPSPAVAPRAGFNAVKQQQQGSSSSPAMSRPATRDKRPGGQATQQQQRQQQQQGRGTPAWEKQLVASAQKAMKQVAAAADRLLVSGASSTEEGGEEEHVAVTLTFNYGSGDGTDGVDSPAATGSIPPSRGGVHGVKRLHSDTNLSTNGSPSPFFPPSSPAHPEGTASALQSAPPSREGGTRPEKKPAAAEGTAREGQAQEEEAKVKGGSSTAAASLQQHQKQAQRQPQPAAKSKSPSPRGRTTRTGSINSTGTSKQTSPLPSRRQSPDQKTRAVLEKEMSRSAAVLAHNQQLADKDLKDSAVFPPAYADYRKPPSPSLAELGDENQEQEQDGGDSLAIQGRTSRGMRAVSAVRDAVTSSIFETRDKPLQRPQPFLQQDQQLPLPSSSALHHSFAPNASIASSLAALPSSASAGASDETTLLRLQYQQHHQQLQHQLQAQDGVHESAFGPSHLDVYTVRPGTHPGVGGGEDAGAVAVEATWADYGGGTSTGNSGGGEEDANVARSKEEEKERRKQEKDKAAKGALAMTKVTALHSPPRFEMPSSITAGGGGGGGGANGSKVQLTLPAGAAGSFAAAAALLQAAYFGSTMVSPRGDHASAVRAARDMHKKQRNSPPPPGKEGAFDGLMAAPETAATVAGPAAAFASSLFLSHAPSRVGLGGGGASGYHINFKGSGREEGAAEKPRQPGLEAPFSVPKVVISAEVLGVGASVLLDPLVETTLDEPSMDDDAAAATQQMQPQQSLQQHGASFYQVQSVYGPEDEEALKKRLPLVKLDSTFQPPGVEGEGSASSSVFLTGVALAEEDQQQQSQFVTEGSTVALTVSVSGDEGEKPKVPFVFQELPSTLENVLPGPGPYYTDIRANESPIARKHKDKARKSRKDKPKRRKGGSGSDESSDDEDSEEEEKPPVQENAGPQLIMPPGFGQFFVTPLSFKPYLDRGPPKGGAGSIKRPRKKDGKLRAVNPVEIPKFLTAAQLAALLDARRRAEEEARRRAEELARLERERLERERLERERLERERLERERLERERLERERLERERLERERLERERLERERLERERLERERLERERLERERLERERLERERLERERLERERLAREAAEREAALAAARVPTPNSRASTPGSRRPGSQAGKQKGSSYAALLAGQQQNASLLPEQEEFGPDTSEFETDVDELLAAVWTRLQTPASQRMDLITRLAAKADTAANFFERIVGAWTLSADLILACEEIKYCINGLKDGANLVEAQRARKLAGLMMMGEEDSSALIPLPSRGAMGFLQERLPPAGENQEVAEVFNAFVASLQALVATTTTEGGAGAGNGYRWTIVSINDGLNSGIIPAAIMPKGLPIETTHALLLQQDLESAALAGSKNVGLSQPWAEGVATALASGQLVFEWSAGSCVATCEAAAQVVAIAAGMGGSRAAAAAAAKSSPGMRVTLRGIDYAAHLRSPDSLEVIEGLPDEE